MTENRLSKKLAYKSNSLKIYLSSLCQNLTVYLCIQIMDDMTCKLGIGHST